MGRAERYAVAASLAGIITAAAVSIFLAHIAELRAMAGALVFGLLLSAGFYLRWRNLVVTTDARGVRSANWFWNGRWGWNDIIGFDYVQSGTCLQAQKFYTGRVLLRNGKHGWLEALTGSKAGNQASDGRARMAIEALNAELAARRW